MANDAVLFIIGLALLTFGADWLVRGAARIAAEFGVSPLIVGLTIVAFGTSAPELVVSGTAALRGQADLAVGNVMGSTVANVGLIAGVGALLRPIKVHRTLLVRETPLLIFVLTIVMLLSLNDTIGRPDGLALVTGFAIYLGFLIRWAKEERDERLHQGTAERTGEFEAVQLPDDASAGDPKDDESAAERRAFWLNVAKIVLGIPALLVGAEFMVDSATALAANFGIPPAVVGATVVAIGTSLPELASTTAAAVRGLGDIAIGNVIGSNVFNLGLVLGTSALLRPLALSPEVVVRLVLPALAFCILLIPLTLTRQRVDRREGVLLLTAYVIFLVWTI